MPGQKPKELAEEIREIISGHVEKSPRNHCAITHISATL